MKKRILILTITVLTLALCAALGGTAWAATAATENTVTLKVDGSMEGRQAQANERLYFTLEAPGATAVRLFCDDGNRTDVWEIWEARHWNTACIEREQMLQEGTQVFWLQARYDDYPEETNLWSDEEEENWAQGMESNRITLTVSSKGQLPEPSAAWVGENTASGLDWLKAEITQGLDMNEWYWADVGHPGEGDDVEWFDQLYFEQDNTLTFPAWKYEPGNYVLDVFAGAFGYQNRSTRLTFTVTESAQAPETALRLSNEQIQAGESLEIVGYVPDAEKLRFVIRKTQDPTWVDVQERDGSFGWLEQWGVAEPGTFTVTLYARTEGDFHEAATATLTVTASDKGRLAAPVFSGFPSVIGPEEGLAGTVGLDERAENCGISVEYCPEDEEWQEIFRTDRRVSDTQTAVTLPAGLFRQDGRYKLNIWVNTPCFESNGRDYWFLRKTDVQSSPVTLTVNGGTEDIASWPSSKDLTIRAQASGATAMRLLRGGEWDYQDCNNGTAEWRTGFGDGDYVLTVQMTDEEPFWREEGFDWGGFRWEALEWGEISNSVRVHVESPNGAKEDPEVTLSAESLHRGENLTVTVTPQAEDEWYWLDVMTLRGNEDGIHCWWDRIRHADFHGNNQLRLSTLLLEPGEYYLQVGIDGEGWDGRQVFLPFTVLEPEAPLPEAVLEFDRETMQTSEGMNVIAYAPGCNHFRLEIRWDRDPDWRDDRDDWGEDSVTWDWGCGCGGEYTFTLYYWKPGETEPGTPLTRHFTVTSYGELDAPDLMNIPPVLDLGQGFEGSFTPVNGAEWYDLGIRYSENGWDWRDLVNEHRGASEPGATEFVFDGSVFSRTGSYYLWVCANAVGKDNGYRDTEIIVIDPASISDSLIMKVEGETDGSLVEAYLHQELQVNVEAPENVTAVRVRNSTSEWEYRVWLDDTYEWRLGVHRGGANTFLVQASTDTAIVDWWNEHHNLRDFDWNSLNWDMTGNTVTVQVIYYGDLDAPEVEFPEGTTVARGDMLAYRISPVEHAWGYGIQVRRVQPDGSEGWELLVDMQLEDLREPLLTALPTDGLEPGNYRLYVDPRCYGWHGDQRIYNFTVTEAAGWQEEPVFRASKTEYMTQEPMIFSAWAPGATGMRLCYASPDNIWFETESDTLVDRVVPNWARVYRVMAYAFYPAEGGDEDGNWVQIGETLEINVTAPYGAMEASLEAPATARADESWTMALTCDFKGTDGRAECYLEDAEGNLMDYHFLEEVDAGGAYTAVWQVDENTLEPGLYYISGYAFPGAKGYALGVAEQVITVSAGEPAGTLTVSKTEAEVSEDIEVTVTVPGATAVGIFDGGWWTSAAGETLTDAWPMWDEGYHVFYGRYTRESVDPEAPGFDWENVNWEGFTNAATVLVNPAQGTLEEPEFTVAELEVERGDEFQVTVTSRYDEVEGVHFGAHLIPKGEEFSDLPWFGADENGIIRVNTLEAEPGEYWLEVSANAISWYGSASRIQVTVSEPPEGARILVAEDSLTTGSVFRIRAVALGASHLKVEFVYSDGEWESDSLEADGEYLEEEGFTGETACTMELILTATYPDSSTATARKAITITAPKGDLHPAIRLPGPWRPQSDLRFTVSVPEDAQYVVWVQDPEAAEDDEAMFAEFIRVEQTHTFELDYTEYGFQEGKCYEIRVVAAGTGYNRGETIVSVGPRSAAATIFSLPAGLTEIEEEAFAGIAAEKIIVPQGVTRIGDRAFADCPNLKELELPEGITFEGEPLYGSGPVFVYGPAGSWLEAYAEAVDGLYFIPTP